MATPRVQPTPPTLACRTLADFPQFVEADGKLTDLQSQLSILDSDLSAFERIPAQHRPDQIEASAQALLSDGGAVVETVPDLAEMRREVQAYHRAIEIQSREVERQRGIAARAIAADLADDHRKLIATFIDSQQAAEAAYESLLTFRRMATGICGVDALPPYAVNEPKRLWYITNFREFITFTRDYVKGESNV